MINANYTLVIGLGDTGFSCVRYLSKKGIPLIVMDSREAPANLEKFRQLYPDIPIYLGKNWPQEILNHAQCIVLSPGISRALKPLSIAEEQGVPILGDIELFARENKVPIIAITGSNGKSTVTTLVGEMARASGKTVAIVGNIGSPVLDILTEDAHYDLIVMELSSFQLETTTTLRPLASTVLNISPDHLDRYSTLADYIKAKHRIYLNTQNAIINKQDQHSLSSEIPDLAIKTFFTLKVPQAGEFGLRQREGKWVLAWGEENLLTSDELKIAGLHNLANALAALALGSAGGLNLAAMLSTLKNFRGLPHRCQWVRVENGVTWINDSKGTNIGATQAALEGIGAQTTGKIILILGGEGKGADFTLLNSVVSQFCRAVILIGKDGPLIGAALENTTSLFAANNMQTAVNKAQAIAKTGDIVLLSPACASFDQYQNYAHRGEDFVASVKGL